ncbi:MAG: alpha-amylase family glycosyl hydrolase [Myxococcota bacterium]
MRRATWWTALLVAVVAAGCIPKVPKQRLAARAKVAVVYVVDPSRTTGVESPPDALKQAVAKALDERNLEVVELPLDVLGGQLLTDARLEGVKRAAGDAPFVMLVEQRVTFFSQLDGRYRWEVGTNLTAQRIGGATARDPFELPVVLLYDHERQKEAIAQAAPDVATRAGVLMDGLLAGARELEKSPQGNAASPTSTTASSAPFMPRAVYFVMVDRFANGDRANDGDANPDDPQAFHGGDLAGLIERLDWIEALGVDTVWLSPISRMRTAPWHGYGAFHGYWTWELGQVEPRFGDEAQVRRLRAELDKRGMKLLLDLVLNHVGPDAPLLTAHPDWFHRNGGVTDWTDPKQLVEYDVHGLPDLATENPEVYRYLVDSTRRWLRDREA